MLRNEGKHQGTQNDKSRVLQLKACTTTTAYVALGFKPRALCTLLYSPSVCPHLSYPFTTSEPPPLLLVMPAVHLDISYALAQGKPHSTPLTDSRAHGMGQTAQSGSPLSGLVFLEQAPAGLMSPGRNHRPPTKPMATFFLIVSAFQRKTTFCVTQRCLYRVTHWPLGPVHRCFSQTCSSNCFCCLFLRHPVFSLLSAPPFFPAPAKAFGNATPEFRPLILTS